MNYVTKQKDIIYETLRKNEGISFTAVSLKEILPFNVSKATIYRQLDFLSKENKIKKYYNDLTLSYEYQYISNKKNCNNHLHLKCNKCGKIYHLDNVIENNMFIIDYAHTMINGICKKCLSII